MRGPAGPVEGHAARLYMDFLPRGRRESSCRAFCIRRALQVDLHLSAASDAPAHLFVLATFRMDDVVPRPCLAKNCNLDVLEQTRISVLEVRCLGGLYGEDLAIAIHLREGQPARQTGHVLWRGRGRIPLLPMFGPFTLQIDSGRDAREQ